MHVQPVPPPQNASRLLYIADAYNREVSFRGANVEHEERNLPPWQRSTDPMNYSNGACPQNFMQYQGEWRADSKLELPIPCDIPPLQSRPSARFRRDKESTT